MSTEHPCGCDHGRHWHESNPFGRRLTTPTKLAELGGLHRPPQVADDRHVMAEEDAVALLRDLPAATAGPDQPF